MRLAPVDRGIAVGVVFAWRAEQSLDGVRAVLGRGDSATQRPGDDDAIGEFRRAGVPLVGTVLRAGAVLVTRTGF